MSIIGHFPRSISQVSWFFLLHGDKYTPGLEYTLQLLFKGRRLFLNPSKTPWLIFEAGVYLEGAFIQGNTVLQYTIKGKQTINFKGSGGS